MKRSQDICVTNGRTNERTNDERDWIYRTPSAAPGVQKVHFWAKFHLLTPMAGGQEFFFKNFKNTIFLQLWCCNFVQKNQKNLVRRSWDLSVTDGRTNERTDGQRCIYRTLSAKAVGPIRFFLDAEKIITFSLITLSSSTRNVTSRLPVKIEPTLSDP